MRITKDSLLGQERVPELADKERINDSPSSSEMDFCARRIGATMIKLGSVKDLKLGGSVMTSNGDYTAS